MAIPVDILKFPPVRHINNFEVLFFNKKLESIRAKNSAAIHYAELSITNKTSKNIEQKTRFVLKLQHCVL